MAPKRKAPVDDADSSKRLRSAIDESIDEFLCPITLALPLEPVLAEDGKVYEKDAIEAWLKEHQRSPVTNLAMGSKLVPATQIKNMIERMVKSGGLPEDKTAEWRRRLKHQEEVTNMRKRAEAGDVVASLTLAKWYVQGGMGLPYDRNHAIRYGEQAAEGGHADGMALLATCYYFHGAAAEDLALALRWASASAALGSGVGTLILGNMYLAGHAGLRKDVKAGFKLLLKGCELGSANSSGLIKLAALYANGTGVAVDIDAAAHWMRKAVAHGVAHPNAHGVAHPNSSAQSARVAREWLTERGLEVDE
jgi:hypothetical protein